VSAGVTTHCAFVDAVEAEDVEDDALDEDDVGEPSAPPPQALANPTATTEPSLEITSRRPTPSSAPNLRIASKPSPGLVPNGIRCEAPLSEYPLRSA